MIRRCAIPIALCLTLGACSSMIGASRPHEFSSYSDGSLWLTPEQMESATCGGSRVLECSTGFGRLSMSRCVCVGP